MKGTNMQKNVVANLNPDPSPLKNELSISMLAQPAADADDVAVPAEEKGARILATLRLPAGRGRGRSAEADDGLRKMRYDPETYGEPD